MHESRCCASKVQFGRVTCQQYISQVSQIKCECCALDCFKLVSLECVGFLLEKECWWYMNGDIGCEWWKQLKE